MEREGDVVYCSSLDVGIEQSDTATLPSFQQDVKILQRLVEMVRLGVCYLFPRSNHRHLSISPTNRTI